MLDQTKYLSMFKIDGKHILPPLMTNKRRLEMQKFKKLAQEVEKRLKEQKIDINPNNHFSNDNEHKQQSVVFNKNNDFKLCKSPTLEKLNKCLESDIEYLQVSSMINKLEANKIEKKISIPLNKQVSPNIKHINRHMSAGDVSIQNEKKKEDCEISLLKKNEIKLDKCKPATPVPTTESDNIERPKLIRSNSYTLDEPSPNLMKFLKQQKGKTTNVQQNEYNIPKYNSNVKQVIRLDSAKADKKTDGESTVDINNMSINNNENNNSHNNFNHNPKQQSINKIKSLAKRTKPRTMANRKSSQHTVPVGNKYKSPYDHKSKIQMKLNKSLGSKPATTLYDLGNIMTAKKQFDTTVAKTPLNQSRMQTPIDNVFKARNTKASSVPDMKSVQETFRKMFLEIEINHKTEMESLLTRQKNEQKLMHESFNKQQEFLMQQLRNNFPTIFKQPLVRNAPKESPVKKQTPAQSPNRTPVNQSSPKRYTPAKILRSNDNHIFKEISLMSSKSPEYCDKNLDSSRPSSSVHTLFYSTAEDCNTDSILSFDELPNKHKINSSAVKRTFTPRSKTSPALQSITNAYLKEYLGSVKQNPPNSEQRHVKCIKRLFETDANIKIPQQSFDYNQKLLNKGTNYQHFLADGEDLTKHNAAITIQAYIRGYLTRRLFKTEYVQTIIQTIKDTLLFVLDLHYEIKNSNNQVDLKLKAQLLQQLTSACYNLHDVFFNKTIQEKLLLIRKDREYLKNKLKRLTMPISRNNSNKSNFNITAKTNKNNITNDDDKNNNNNNNDTHNNNYTTTNNDNNITTTNNNDTVNNNNINKSKNDCLKILKLEKCSLFPVNIRASTCPRNYARDIKYTKSMNNISVPRRNHLANQNNKNLNGSISNENIPTNESKIFILSKFLKSIKNQKSPTD